MTAQMQTRILDLAADPKAMPALMQAILKDSQPVGIPTETVYGLAANAFDELACARIFQVKGRPTDNPLICHISSMEMIPRLAASIPEKVRPVLERFWPGPLTVLLPKTEQVPDIVSAGHPTVGVRFPSHPVAIKIIEAVGVPLAAPSANLSGRPSPTSAQHVLDDLAGRIPFIAEGGSSSVGLESTVLDVTSEPPMILRPGAITAAMLRPFLPDIQVYGADPRKRDMTLEDRPPTPGMKYKHYAPTAPAALLRPGVDSEERLVKYLQDHPEKRIVRLCTALRPEYPQVSNIYLSKTGDVMEVARNLFAGLRDADLTSPDQIISETVQDEDHGLAIMNRLSKAATSHL